jgi:hypothetical protein
LRDNDSGFDLNLRFWLIKNCDELPNRLDVFLYVRNNQCIAAAIYFDRTAS